MSYVSYPEIEDETFYDTIFRKKEFNKTLTGPEFLSRDPNEICRPGEFKMQNHQEFVRNFMSPETPYNGMLLFHGTGVGKTCAAMGITEGIKEYTHKMGKKIYIISSGIIRENFLRELYNEKRADKEKSMHSPPGSYQCVGDAYHVSEIEYPDPEKRKRKIKDLIKKYYEFKGPGEFANYVDITLKDKFGMTDAEIGHHFSNCVFVIDEAHGIAGYGKLEERKKKVKKGTAGTEVDAATEDVDDTGSVSSSEIEEQETETLITKKKVAAKISNRSLLLVMSSIISECQKLGSNIKLILLTATPMKDNQSELADLLELLNRNDGKSIDRKGLFPDESTFNKALLQKYARGYISYVRGNNPITFPLALLPEESTLYNPRPKFAYDSGNDIEDEYVIPLDTVETHHYQYNLVKCPMSLYQFKLYRQYVDKKTENARGDAADIYGRQISNIVFPAVNTHLVATTLAKASDISKLYGTKGLTDVFVERKKPIPSIDPDSKKQRQHLCYEYKDQISTAFGLFLMLDNPVNPDYGLSVFSSKFAKIVSNINESKGIAYAYSEFDGGGARSLALALEANGYIRYDPALKFNKYGLVSNLDQVPQARMLIYTSTHNQTLYTTHLKMNFRCAVCGKLYTECKASEDHQFRQATYMLYTGTIGKAKEIDVLGDPSNVYGHKIKVIVGTKVTGEGIDFKWIRQVHIVDPWHNNTRIYQAIGRGIRHCSHIDLKPEERNVTIFKYSSSVPEIMTEEYGRITNPYEQLGGVSEDKVLDKTGITCRDLLTETIDEKIYQRVVRKDIYIKTIERVLKEVAVDCAFNRHVNYYGEADQDYSRECDYQKCKYDCYGFSSHPEFIDISIRQDEGGYSIRSEAVFGDLHWRDEITDEEYKAILDATRSIAIEIDFDPLPLTSNSNEKMQAIFDDLSRVGQKHQTSEGVEIHIERSPGNIDISTYNVHFAQPQITKARMYISRLFRENVALNESTIIRLVQRIDALIDAEFVRLAIDQLVGNPPFIAPKEIRDRYNRSGFIIFVGGYYVFQPFDVDDKTVPVYYRVNPLKIKRNHLNINQMALASDTTSASVYKFDIIEINKKIAQLLHHTGKEDDSDRILAWMRIRGLMDRLVLADQEYIFKTIIAKSGKTEEEQELADVLTQYYQSQNVLFVDEYRTYLLLNPDDKLSVYENGVWSDINYTDSLAENLPNIIGRSVTVGINSTGEEEYEGIYGFLAPTQKDRQKTVSDINDNLRLEWITRALKNLNSYINTSLNTNLLRFKIVDIHTESTQTGIAGDISARTLVTGGVCTTKQEPSIRAIIEKIYSLFETEDIEIFDPVIKETISVPADIFTSMELGNKEIMCDSLEIALRVLDCAKFLGKKWFLSPIEIEYYRPMKIKK